MDAIDDEFMQTMDEDSACVKCSRPYMDPETREYTDPDTDNWLITDDEAICPACLTGFEVVRALAIDLYPHWDDPSMYRRIVASLEQLGAEVRLPGWFDQLQVEGMDMVPLSSLAASVAPGITTRPRPRAVVR